jgi:uncharacterized delta-60 repeat protein
MTSFNTDMSQKPFRSFARSRFLAALLPTLALTLELRAQSPLPDPEFNPAVQPGPVMSMAVQPDGKILVGGEFMSWNNWSGIRLGRLNRDGTPDETFAPIFFGQVYSLAVQADGRILVGGVFGGMGGGGEPRLLARLNADGTLDAGFDPQAEGDEVGAIAVQRDGKVLVGGDFTGMGGQPRSCIARLNPDGTLDAWFIPSANGPVTTLAVQADGKILVGGSFTAMNGQVRNRLARLNPDGTLDVGFNPNANDEVLSLALQPNGRILVGGNFTSLSGQSRNRIARLNPDGSLDLGFNPGANGAVVSLAMRSDGHLLVGGRFSILGGKVRHGIAQLEATGIPDTGFDPQADGNVECVAVQADGRTLVGGWFTAMGGQTRLGIARLSDTNAVTDELTYDGDAIVWDRGGAGSEVWRTTFEYSPAGTGWLYLGEGNRIDGGWTFDGVTLTGGLIRARGYTVGGFGDAAGGIVETTNSVALAAPGHYLLNRAFYGAIGGQEWCWFYRNAFSLLLDYTAYNWWPPLPSTPTYSSYSTWRQHVLFHLPAYMESGLSACEPGCWYCAQLVTWEDPAFRATGGVWLQIGSDSCAPGGGPFFDVQPTSCTNDAGKTAVFSVGVDGSGPFAYQWRKGGVNLNDGGNVAGSATATLTFFNVMRNDEGAYDAVVSNYDGGGAAISDLATLTVVDPVIVQQPASQFVNAYGAVTLRVAAAGTGPLSYQWREGGLSLPGATNADVTVFFQEGQENGYDVEVRGVYGFVTSAVAFLNTYVDADFNSDANDGVLALAVQTDGKILVGGRFTTLSGENRNYIGRLNANGTPDSGFHPDVDDWVHSIAVQQDGRILIGGTFQTVAGMPCNHIGRLHPDGSLDTSFHPSVDGEVKTIMVQRDGKILVAGTVESPAGHMVTLITRLNADGSRDTDFHPVREAGGVDTMAIQSDGKILVAGNTVSADILRLNPDGTLDDDFCLWAADGVVRALALQSDGKILVGGAFTNLSDPFYPPQHQARSHIARLNPDGTLDTTFDPGANNEVETLVVQADSKIIVGGWFTDLAGQLCRGIGRLNADGTLDGGFPGEADGSVQALALQVDGGILVGGDFTHLAGVGRYRIARLNNTGVATQTLNYDGSAIAWLRGGTSPEVRSVTFEHSTNGIAWSALGDGQRVSGGWQLTGVGVTGGVIRARGFTAGGQYNASGGMVETLCGALLLAAQPAARTNLAGSTAAFAVAAVGPGPLSYQWRKDGLNLSDGGNVSGADAATLTLSNVLRDDQGGYDVVVSNVAGCVTSVLVTLTVVDPAILVHPEGRYASPGDTVEFAVTAAGTGPLTYQWRKAGVPLEGATDASLAITDIQASDMGGYDVEVCGLYGCVTSTTAVLAECVDTAFDPGAGAPVRALALQADGRILVGGWFTTFANQERNHIARLNADGTLDSGFNPNANGEVCTLAVQPDGKILVGGGFTSMAGQSCERIARLNADGTVDSSFTPGADNDVYALVVQANGAILAGGAFSTVAGQTRHGIALLNADGTLDGDFDPDADGVVRSLAVQADGKIVAGGGFTSMAGQTRNAIARLNVEGSLDPDFNPGATGEVIAIAIQADGKVLLGGEFTAMANHARRYLARLDADGTLDQVFDPRANEQVSCLAVQADGSILVGGLFTTLNGEEVRFLGRLNADGIVDKGFNPAVNNGLYSLTIQADGKVLFGGWFSSVAGQPSSYIARLNSLGVANQELVYDGNVMSWRRGGTSPEVWRTTFEHSINGTEWTALGAGSRVNRGWQLAGLALSGGVVRARGYVTGGFQDGSCGLVESRLEPDADEDGLPDWWELAYFEDPLSAGWDADSDDDGMNNRAEFLAGTNPRLRDSCLSVWPLTAPESGAFTLVWPSIPGKTYKVFYVDNLGETWRDDLPASQVTAAEGASSSYADETWGATTSRFYRVRLVP